MRVLRLLRGLLLESRCSTSFKDLVTFRRISRGRLVRSSYRSPANAIWITSVGKDPAGDPMTSSGRTIDQEGERQLIDGLLRHDSYSLASIYDAHGAIAYALALRLVGDRNEAEDVLQEAFLALWRQAERLDPARGIRSYLLTIVHNKAVDRLRRRSRRNETSLDPAAPVAAGRGDPVSAAEQLADREAVLAALQDLPAEQRRAVEMTYFTGMTINQVAARMSVPVGTVKSRLRLALGHMRRAIENPK
jgi:RNA polymerase sigma-70 factor (ECF subfamily)